MAWPVAADVAARTGVPIIDGTTEYGLSVTDLLARAKSFCETYCDRQFDEAEVTEMHDYSPVISVTRPPIVTVEKIVVGVAELSTGDYAVYPSYIRLSSQQGELISTTERYQTDALTVLIKYIGGYSDESSGESGNHIPIPSELKEIVLELACRQLLIIHNAYREVGGAAQFSLGNYSVTFGSTVPWAMSGGGLRINEDLLLRLDRYKRVTV